MEPIDQLKKIAEDARDHVDADEVSEVSGEPVPYGRRLNTAYAVAQHKVTFTPFVVLHLLEVAEAAEQWSLNAPRELDAPGADLRHALKRLKGLAKIETTR